MKLGIELQLKLVPTKDKEKQIDLQVVIWEKWERAVSKTAPLIDDKKS